MYRHTVLSLALGQLLAYPLLDATSKGTVILLVAALAVTVRRRDSAATRHFLWGTAICLLVVMPLLSLVLPHWRVLPMWMSAALHVTTADTAKTTPVSPIPQAIATAGTYAEAPSAPTDQMLDGGQFAAVRPSEPPAAVARIAEPVSDHSARATVPTMAPAAWSDALAWVWFAGCLALMVRLVIAAWLLRKSECHAVCVVSLARDDVDASATRPPADVGSADAQRITRALEHAQAALQVSRSVRLLLDAQCSIPVVGGLWRVRLQLPLQAVQWSDAQLQSVLLHELAHVRRRDLAILAITQVACALHWFNPLVWYAAWRLHAERERACDDLVLNSGVRPSSYAEHILSIVAQLRSTRWTQACGLAMARSAGLESRLHSVLNSGKNRRAVTMAAASLLVLLSLAVAVPVSMLRAATAEKSRRAEDARQTVPSDETIPPSTSTPNMSAPSTGTLAAELVRHLEWGAPANGLKCAVLIRQGSGEGDARQYATLWLVIQNVSDSPIRLCDTVSDKFRNKRTLYLRERNEILFAISSDESTGTDVLLQPQQLLHVDFFPQAQAADDARHAEAIVEGLQKDPYQSVNIVWKIEQAPDAAWTGQLQTPVTRGAISALGPMPASEPGQRLFRHLVNYARRDGTIPGGWLDLLEGRTRYFIELNDGDQYGNSSAQSMKPLLRRFEKTGDWSQADVVSLFDSIAAVSPIPLDITLEQLREHALQQGSQLPREFQNANWGSPLPGGLRMAWVLEPTAHEYPLGSALKSRVLLHNAGEQSVAFVTRRFQQPRHTAKDAQGRVVDSESSEWLTIAPVDAYRLHPGEFCEVDAPGIGIGERQDTTEDWANVRPGTWLLAQAGDEVTFEPGAILLTGDHHGQVNNGWWLEWIKERLHRDDPLPADPQEREFILFRAVQDLFGTSPYTSEADAFYKDDSPQALDHLADVLSQRSWSKAVTGAIQAGSLRFKVVAPDPRAATRPRIATNPGRYPFGEEVHLVVTRRQVGARIVHEASLVWYPRDKGQEPVPLHIELPDGYRTWAAGWVPGTHLLWVAQKDLLRSYDFSDPALIKSTEYVGGAPPSAIPADVKSLLDGALKAGDTSAQPAAAPASPAR